MYSEVIQIIRDTFEKTKLKAPKEKISENFVWREKKSCKFLFRLNHLHVTFLEQNLTFFQKSFWQGQLKGKIGKCSLRFSPVECKVG